MTLNLTVEETLAEAQRLDHAEQTRTQVTPLTDSRPELTLDDAYAIQAAWKELRLGRGEQMIGHKIGLTSRAMQSAMNITTPDSGFLTDAMWFEPDSKLNAADFCDPKLEIELAFHLQRDLTGDVTIDDVLDASEWVAPAVELIAARSFRRDPATGRTRTVIDTIADNAANGGIVCGPTRLGPRDIDLRWVSALGYRNGIIEETGVAAGVLDHPANGIVWLAQRYAQVGLHLQAGQTILAGSFTRPIDIRAGDEFHFDFGPVGSFGLQFT